MNDINIVTKGSHTVVSFNKSNANITANPTAGIGSTILHRMGWGGGRPPDNRNKVFLKGQRVVKKNTSWNLIARTTSSLPCDLFKEDNGDIEDLRIEVCEDDGDIDDIDERVPITSPHYIKVS